MTDDGRYTRRMGRGQAMELRTEEHGSATPRRRRGSDGDWLTTHPLLREHPAVAAVDRAALGVAWPDGTEPTGAWWRERRRWRLPRATDWEASVWVTDPHATEPFRAFVVPVDGGPSATACGTSVEQAIWMAMSRRRGAGARMPSIADLRAARDVHFPEERLQQYRPRPHALDLDGALFGARRPTT